LNGLLVKYEVPIDRNRKTWRKVKGHLGEVGTFGGLFGVYVGNQRVQKRNTTPSLESLDLIWVVGIRCGKRIMIDYILGSLA
jgi:hypothetical protein